MGVLPTLVASCLMLGVAAQAGAECTTKSYKLSLPDSASVKLPDGEHTLGSVQTAHRSFEARVNVKGKVASGRRFFIGGRLLRDVSESTLPEGLRDCLKNAPATPSTPETWVATAVRSALDWIVVPAEARGASHSSTDWYITELCFKGTNANQVCTYKVCTVDINSKRTCTVLFVTGA
jgi:hypothetical protein